ncbi:MAG: hypothetical protein OEM04_04845 [Flavobacteriaceae bacterium]|nr:hypothetical protein [Flavobacteriaceae bacterium]
MDISIFLAKFWGWYMILFFVLLIIYPKRVKQLFAYAKDDKFIIMISFLTIIIGLLNVISHNLWVADWRIVITLFGWFALAKGISLFAFPQFAMKWIYQFDFKWFHLLMFLLFIVGVLLLNQAYVWVPF